VLGLLARHPLRALRLPLLIVPMLGYLLGITSRGGLKGAILFLLFRGMRREAILQWSGQYAQRVMPGRMFTEGVAALRAHLAAGDRVVLLSASPDLHVPQIGSMLGVHETVCTRIRWQEDRLDGRLLGENRRGEEKLRVLEGLRQAQPGIPVIAYGNSESDLPHMVQCEQAVYVNAGPALSDRLAARGIRCVHWQ
jgi:phosphatidylglycerophosphatase C